MRAGPHELTLGRPAPDHWQILCFVIAARKNFRRRGKTSRRDEPGLQLASHKETDVTKSKLLVITFALLIIAMASPVFAGPVPSRAVSPAIDRTADMTTLHDAVAIKGVSDALAAQGFTTDEINTRLASLSDQDLHSLAQNVEQIQAAGITREQWIWIGIGALAVALLVALTS